MQTTNNSLGDLPLDLSWNAANRTTAIQDALGHATDYRRYNAHGQPEEIVEPNGLVTTLAYDARRRLVYLQAGGQLTAYTYGGKRGQVLHYGIA